MSTNPKYTVVRNFTPAWFAVNTGTGVVSVLLFAFPYENVPIFRILSFIVHCLNLLLFILFSFITLLRYIFFPEIWAIMIRHPVQSLFTSTFPMGASTLISMSIRLAYAEGFPGNTFLYTMLGLWWCDVALSVLSCWGMVFVMITMQDHDLSKMTVLWLLPVIPLIVVSSSGGVLTSALLKTSPPLALFTLTVSAILLIIGLSLTFMILASYVLRLIVHGLPQGALILSTFLPLGQAGQAGYSFLLIGRSFKAITPHTGSESEFLTSSSTGDIINIFCICIAFALWSTAVMWVLFAFLGVQNVLRQARPSFAVTFWGLLFPNGVFANLTIELAGVFDSPFFRVMGATYAVATIILWLVILVRTIMLTRGAHIFHAPCLEDWNLSRCEAGKLKLGGKDDGSTAVVSPDETQCELDLDKEFDQR